MKLFNLNLILLFLFLGSCNFSFGMDESIGQTMKVFETSFKSFINHYKSEPFFRSTVHKFIVGGICIALCIKASLKIVQNKNCVDNLLTAGATGFVAYSWVPNIQKIISPERVLEAKAQRLGTQLNKLGNAGVSFAQELLKSFK